jgi:hypothetical protein
MLTIGVLVLQLVGELTFRDACATGEELCRESSRYAPSICCYLWRLEITSTVCT